MPLFQRTASKILLAGLAAAALAAVLYVRTGGGASDRASACAAPARLAALRPLMVGDVAGANPPTAGGRLPDLAFFDASGAPVSLADRKGKIVLLNLWATWCAPCREEMPTLDRLQRELGGDSFEVVALNIDTARLEKAQAFYKEIGVRDLAFYSDPKADAFYKLKMAGKVVGLPTTFLLDRDGCELAAMSGPANWASPDALRLARAAIGAGPAK